MKTLIEEIVTEIFEKHCTASLVERAEIGEQGWSAELWGHVSESELDRVAVAEHRGGSGGSWSDCISIVRIAAGFAAPIPLSEQLFVGSWVRSMIDHDLTGVVVGHAAGGELVGAASGGKITVAGEVESVPWARTADHAVLPTRVDGQALRLVIVPVAECTVTPFSNLAGEPRDRVTAANVEVAAAHVLEEATPEELLDRLALARASQIAGALESILAQVVRYTAERHQFGKPLARFQAVQRLLADLAYETASAGAAIDAIAVGLLDRDAASIVMDPTLSRAIRAATVRTADAASRGARIAHQAMGAIGFTREHPLHHLTRRLWSWRDEPVMPIVARDRLFDAIPNPQVAGGLWRAIVEELEAGDHDD